MAAILLYGDTLRYPALRHEIPLEIVDPLLFVARDGQALVLTSSLEAARIAEVVPGVELLLFEELGFFELVEGGMPFEEAELEIAVRAVKRWGVERAVVPADLPVAVADRLRGAGIGVEVDVRARRRSPPRQDGGRAGRHPARAGRRRGRDGRRRGADPERRPARRAACNATGSRSRPSGCARRSVRPARRQERPRRRPSWSSRRCPAAATTRAPGRCPPTCRSRSTCGRATRRAAAGPT